MIRAIFASRHCRFFDWRAADNQSIESFGTARINVDGSPDASFGTNGIVITDFPNPDSNIFRSAVARTVSILPNGKIFIVGTGGTGSGGSIRDFYFAAQLNADGSPDSSFGTGGKIRAEAITIANSAITQSGKIIVIGPKNGIFGVARLNPNGTIDTTFGTGGTEYPLAIALQTDGKIIVSGGANNPNTSGPGMDYTLIARYNGTAAAPVNNPALRIADFDGDGKTDIAVWRENANSTFYILQSSTNTVRIENFGRTGDDPTIVGDYDGDGKADPAVYRNGDQSYFYYRGSLNNPNGGITYIPYGSGGDKPVRGDFDGGGKLDTAVYRPSDGVWYIRKSSNNQTTYTQFGLPNDKRISGDFDGDGKTDITVFRDGVWYILQSSNGQIRYVNWRLSTDKIAAGDYDGDGKTDFAVWRSGVFYVLNNSTSAVSYQNFGVSGDVPAASVYVR